MKGRMDEHMLARRSGAWIRGAVEQYGLPVGDLAATAGVPMERLARLASGADYPSPDEIDAIAGAVARHVGARWDKADSITSRGGERCARCPTTPRPAWRPR